MQITWIRHGQTSENVKGSYYGQTDPALTQEGVRQIQDLKTKIVAKPVIYVSPTQRAIETAEILFGEQSVTIDARLLERHMGKWEGLSFSEIEKGYPVECSEWEADWVHFVMPEGESAQQQFERVGNFVEHLARQNQDAVVVAHAGTIRMAIAYMLGQNIELFWRFQVETGGVVQTRCEEGYWYIESIEGNKRAKASQCVLVTGGVRSGKSKYAESLYKDTDDVLYLATAKIIGEEMAIRVQRHREWRNQKWETHEGYRDLDEVIRQTDKSNLLLDCVTIFTSNFMFEDELPFEEKPHEEQEAILAVILEQMTNLIQAAKEADKNLVLVTNEVGNGIVPAYALGRIYRDYIGIINAKIAQMADEVYEVKCGLPIRLK